MRKWFVFAFLAVLLMACGTIPFIQSAEDEPTAEPAVPAGDVETPASPRDAVQDLGLPPTFTPPPTQPPPTPYTPRAGGVTGSGGTVQLSGDTYTVQRGDTLGEIAAAYGVSVQALAQANGISNIDVIEVGTVLVIPER